MRVCEGGGVRVRCEGSCCGCTDVINVEYIYKHIH